MYKYDAYGRIVEDATGGHRYTYDGANRTGVWGMSAGTGPTDTWVYDGVDHPLEHFDTKGNRQYYELDLTGSVRRLRAPGGADLGGYRYTAFGQQVTGASAPPSPQGVSDLPARWKGRWVMYSAGVGTANAVELYDMRARWWWPRGGVFVSVDDFTYHSMQTTLWAWPGQNPLRYSDPSGHFGLGDIIAAFAEWFGSRPMTPADYSNTAPFVAVQTSSVAGVDIPLHSSIITSNGKGQVSNFRGEPVHVINKPDELGASRWQHKPFEDPDWDHDAQSVVIVSGSLAAAKLQCIAAEIKRINKEHAEYNACSGPNSNSVAATALANCGIPAGNTFGYLPGFTPSL